MVDICGLKKRAIDYSNKNIDKFREVLAIFKAEGHGDRCIANFCEQENLNFTKNQIAYYLKKNPITPDEIKKAKKELSS